MTHDRLSNTMNGKLEILKNFIYDLDRDNFLHMAKVIGL